MDSKDYDSSSSGFLNDSFEGISQTFTDVEILHDSGENILAKAKRYGRWCLLKGLSKEVADKTTYQLRQRKELEIMLQLQHPSIVTTYGFEEVDSLGSCIVMEYIEGQTLNDWLEDHPSLHERRRVAVELTEAVSYIHSKGIAHRDLKPRNILITRNGSNVKIIDFGLADTDSHAMLKQPAGTLHYMSPEQMETAVADCRNDIYSLGVVFGYMELGWVYQSVIRKCLRPINQRYQRSDDLLHELGVRESLGQKLFYGLLAAIIILLIGWNSWQLLSSPQQEQNDSTWSAEQQAKFDAQSQELAMMRDSFQALQHENHSIMTEQREHSTQRQRVTDAIQNGCQLIDKVCLQSQLDQHLDTLSHMKYICSDFLEKSLSGSRAINGYCEQISNNFNEIEMAEIRNALTLHDAEYQRKWNKKLETIRK